MADTGLRYGVAQLPRARQHLRIDEEARCLRQQGGNDLLVEDLQGAITIANAGAEQAPHQRVVTPGEEAPSRRILPIDAVTHGDRMFLRQVEQAAQIGEVKLAIGVRERDALELRGGKSG